MKTVFFFFTLLLVHPLVAEFYGGVGFAWNTIDESFESTLCTNEHKSGHDRYKASTNRLAPVAQLGYQYSFCHNWTTGILAQWKYLNNKTPNENSSRGQILPNASFSSINIFGPEVIRDFTSKTKLNNEVLVLGYVGRELCKGSAYLGLGPVFFDASNSVYVTSVHTPDGTGDHLLSTSVTSNKAVWGGAVQAGYQYYLSSCFFINIGYAYIQTGSYDFKNTVNTAILNGHDHPGDTKLSLKRSIKFSVQEFILSLNLAF